MTATALPGPWEFRFEDEQDWRPIDVPGCWEESAGVAKDRSGPALYRAQVAIPAADAAARLWLRFGGVSYDCTVFVDGQEAGRHTGIWDAFVVEITAAAQPGATVELLVRVEKPASLTHGPRSPSVAGSFPMPETLAGFLPYVWGHIFGGIWQQVELITTGGVRIMDVHARGTAAGELSIVADLSGPADLRFTLYDPDGREIHTASCASGGATTFAVQVAEPLPWSPERPALYRARLSVDGDEREVRFGLRSLAVEGSTITLNGRPLYPRMALSWGWYAEALDSNPGPERVRADFERLRALGYNGVKLCLWVPPSYYFDLADELGMLLWLELPMWLPQTTEYFQRQTPIEYERIVRQARNHPAVILYTLGCELNSAVGADLLEMLFRLVKPLVGDALVRDNSGSGEAYGGLLNEFAEYYDYHFYTDIQFMRPLLDYFSPRWRPEMPFLFGEFCDLDTFRDLRRVYAANGGSAPWWASGDPELNPQGARWQFDIPEVEARLRANGFWERGAELERVSARQALLHRKVTLELVRAYREIGGYVVTGEVDTPISTAGMWNDLAESKFDPEELLRANSDLVLLVGWDKRRAWIAGGDRAAFWDTWDYPAGATVRGHLIVSHYGATEQQATVRWSIGAAGRPALAEGDARSPFVLRPGDVREVTIAEFVVPDVERPHSLCLSASVEIGGEQAENSWPVWVFPRDPWSRLTDIGLVDPTGRLRDLAPMLSTDSGLTAGGVVLATAWTPEVRRFVAGGGHAVLLQAKDGPAGPLPAVEMPFWREGVKLIEPHPAWGDFPHEGFVDLQFYGCATDCAVDTSDYALARPILRRVDARTMAVHDYATEITLGAGRLIVSTLRFEGGLGDQPLGISRNTAAAYLLTCWLEYLRRA
jgi:hypothetical protein